MDQSVTPPGLSTPTKELLDVNEANTTTPRRPLTRRKLFWSLLALGFIVVVLVVVLPVVFTVVKKNGGMGSSAESDHGSGVSGPLPTGGPVSTYYSACLLTITPV